MATEISDHIQREDREENVGDMASNHGLESNFLSSAFRSGHPDFLDLPWKYPLTEWSEHCSRLMQLPHGVSRHPVVFVNYGGRLYAIKELPPGLAEKEYDRLRQMEELRLPVVTPVGHIRTRSTDGEASVLITRYLHRSLPYHSLFIQHSLARYREHLLDAMASLLVQLHLAEVYWGDCSLFNTLFRRDAGALQAYLVDAETSEIYPHLSLNLRQNDLDIMEENVTGALADLAAMDILPSDYPIFEIGAYIRQRYEALWHEIIREEILAPGERYRIQERIRALNALGFSVDEVELRATESGDQLHLRAFVTDRNFHRDLLHTLTGLETEEMQARHMVNEIQGIKATLSEAHNRSTPLSVAAYYWLNEIYPPTLEHLNPLMDDDTDPAELYCQVLEHKWYLSERARRDVGHQAAVEDFLRHFAIVTSHQGS
ncbi:MAG: DUF4032 domain-containing protein [Candidatus Bipolaricaulia bacterium]